MKIRTKTGRVDGAANVAKTAIAVAFVLMWIGVVVAPFYIVLHFILKYW